MLTQLSLKELMQYDPETGLFLWLVRRQGIRNGGLAGSFDTKGYLAIRVGGQRYRAHRLAWLYMTGEWPADQIDHINMDKADNRWINLREAVKSQNMANTTRRVDNTSGFKGVSWNKGAKKFRVQLEVAKKRVHVGYYDTAEEGRDAYIEAAKIHFGAFARAA